MAKLVNLRDYNERRKIESFHGFSFENENGDTIVITKKELRQHLEGFLQHEIYLYGDELVKSFKVKMESDVDERLSEIVGGLEKHLNDKIIKITEDIISKSTSRLIEAEVNRRVDEKLQKIKEFLK